MKKYSGFTLIELMITLFIIGILLMVGLPSMKSFMQSNQLVAATNDLLSAVHVARAEAIKINGKVTVCESSNGTSCSTTGNWEGGWIVFIDTNGDGIGTGAVCSAANTDCLLRVHDGFTDPSLTIAGLDADNQAIEIFTFTSRGLPKNNDGSPQSGTFSVCSGNGDRAVILSLSGRVRISDNAAVITCP
ncbi:MAG: prepilin-type N-terminal cleavage/methylation domain-containing protein [Gammaproteobacteria bacterium]|nr:prepilin-type N-terminal cleavage/methylation domain-containing protein [Gammaproteobacteria bacterium]